jgi:hypothetical protein
MKNTTETRQDTEEQTIELNDIICELKLILEQRYPDMVERTEQGLKLSFSDGATYVIGVTKPAA